MAPTPALPPICQFRRLTPTEQLERRRQGLCYNCDEPFIRGHQCKQLFYLESVDYLDDDVPAEVAVAAAFDLRPAEAPTVQPANVAAPDADPRKLSLYAIAGIRFEDTMLLSVDLRGQWVANFVSADLMRRLLPEATTHPTLRVLFRVKAWRGTFP